MLLVRRVESAAKRLARFAAFTALVMTAALQSTFSLATTPSKPTDTLREVLAAGDKVPALLPNQLSPSIRVALDSRIPDAAMRDSIKPLYPEQARQQGVEGYVVVQFDITREGDVTGAHVIEAQPANYFENAAIDAVRQYRFAPNNATREDIAIRGAVNRFVFSLTENTGAFKPSYVPYRGRTFFALNR